MGKAYSEAFAEEDRLHAAESPRYRWIGKVPRWKARRLLARSRLLVQTSIMEGGANAISEALAARVPVLASYIPGNVSILGKYYPGCYPVGDEKALARLLYRGETDDTYYETLETRCDERRYLVCPRAKRRLQGVWWRRSGPERWARIQSACEREDAHKADEVLAEGRLSF